MKIREVQARLHKLGCHPDRISGSHQIWISPAGRTLPPLRIAHIGDDIQKMFLSKIIMSLRKEGINFNN